MQYFRDDKQQPLEIDVRLSSFDAAQISRRKCYIRHVWRGSFYGFRAEEIVSIRWYDNFIS